jgi:hypothetical protein
LLRLTAEKALAADYFTTLVGFTPASLLWSHVPVYISRVKWIISFRKSRYLTLFFSIEKKPAPTPLSLMPTFPTKHKKLSNWIICRGMNTRAWAELWR